MDSFVLVIVLQESLVPAIGSNACATEEVSPDGGERLGRRAAERDLALLDRGPARGRVRPAVRRRLRAGLGEGGHRPRRRRLACALQVVGEEAGALVREVQVRGRLVGAAAMAQVAELEADGEALPYRERTKLYVRRACAGGKRSSVHPFWIRSGAGRE